MIECEGKQSIHVNDTVYFSRFVPHKQIRDTGLFMGTVCQTVGPSLTETEFLVRDVAYAFHRRDPPVEWPSDAATLLANNCDHYWRTASADEWNGIIVPAWKKEVTSVDPPNKS